MRFKIKKWAAIGTTLIIFSIMIINVAIAWHYFKNFAIPSIAYAVTTALMVIINNTDRHVSHQIDFFDQQDFSSSTWQNRQLRLIPVFVIASLAFDFSLIVLNL